MKERGGSMAQQTTLSVRIDGSDKQKFEQFCKAAGMNVSVAINMFVKKVVNEQRIPFEVSVDPFYSEANMTRLRKSIDQLNAGKGKEHELIEVD